MSLLDSIAKLGGSLTGSVSSVQAEAQAAADQATQAVYAILGEGLIIILLLLFIALRVRKRSS